MTDAKSMAIIASIAGAYIDETDTLENRVRTAFQAAINNGIILDENAMFAGALAAVVISYPEDSQDRINLQDEVAALQVVNAMFLGIPVDLGRVKIPEHTIGVTKIWKEMYDR